MSSFEVPLRDDARRRDAERSEVPHFHVGVSRTIDLEAAESALLRNNSSAA
jgi:hypothetical protein